MANFEVFKNSNIRRLFLAQLISQICDKLMLVGVIWYVTDRSASQWTPWFIGMAALPHLVMAKFAPRLIERLGGPLRTVITTDYARGALFVLAGIIGIFSSSQNALAIPSLFALFVFSNFLASLFNPALLSLPPRLSSEPAVVQKTTALLDSCFSSSAVVAPLVSTAIFALFGLSGLLLVNGVSYLYAAILEGQVKLRPEISETQASGETTERSFNSLLNRDPLLGSMLISFFCMNLFLGPLIVFLPIFAKQVYGGTIGTLAWLETALGVGTLAGSVLLSIVHLRGDPWKPILLSLSFMSLCYLAFTASSTLPAGAISVAGLGILLSVANVSILGFFQTRAEPKDLVPLMSWVNLISVASLPLSTALAGIALKFVDPRGVAIFCAVLLMMVTSATAAAPYLTVGTGLRTKALK